MNFIGTYIREGESPDEPLRRFEAQLELRPPDRQRKGLDIMKGMC